MVDMSRKQIDHTGIGLPLLIVTITIVSIGIGIALTKGQVEENKKHHLFHPAIVSNELTVTGKAPSVGVFPSGITMVHQGEKHNSMDDPSDVVDSIGLCQSYPGGWKDYLSFQRDTTTSRIWVLFSIEQISIAYKDSEGKIHPFGWSKTKVGGELNRDRKCWVSWEIPKQAREIRIYYAGGGAENADISATKMTE